MSLRIAVPDPGCPSFRGAHELPIGTWFTDETGEVYVTVLDDDSGRKKVICMGPSQRPFICTGSPEQFTKLSILPLGTQMKIIDAEAA